MVRRSSLARQVVLLVSGVCGLAAAAYDGHNFLSYPSNQDISIRHNIPKKLEIKGGDPVKIFSKYVADVENLAKTKNLAIKYDINVILQKKKNEIQVKSKRRKHRVSKKYVVPLKRVKGGGAVGARPAAERETPRAAPQPPPTTAPPPDFYTTAHYRRVDKYKPVYNRVGAPPARRVRPVRTNTVDVRSYKY